MERKSELTKALLGEKFKELVAKKGFEKLTIKIITDAAGVIRPTFYNYFQVKTFKKYATRRRKGISGISCNIIGEWTEILAYPGKQKYFGGRCNGILSVYDVTFNPGSVGH